MRFIFGYLLLFTIQLCALNTQNPIKILSTSALLRNHYEERKKEYIHSLQVLEQLGYRDRVYLVEAGPTPRDTFLNNYCDHVLYSNTNKPRFRNYGINEVLSMRRAFEYFKFDDEDMIIKLTGRYFFNSDFLMQTIRDNPNVEAFASHSTLHLGGVQTGCFAMRAKYFKQMLDEFDIKIMKRDNIFVEYLVERFLQKLLSEHVNVQYLNKTDITAFVSRSCLLQL